MDFSYSVYFVSLCHNNDLIRIWKSIHADSIYGWATNSCSENTALISSSVDNFKGDSKPDDYCNLYEKSE